MGQIGRNLVVPIKLRIPEATARQLDCGGEAPPVKQGNSPNLNLRSLNLHSVRLRRCNFFDNEDVGLEAATI